MCDAIDQDSLQGVCVYGGGSWLKIFAPLGSILTLSPTPLNSKIEHCRHSRLGPLTWSYCLANHGLDSDNIAEFCHSS